MKVSFDECFQTFPAIQAPEDLDKFWQKALLALKKIPLDPKQRLVLSKSLGRESRSEVSFQSFGSHRLQGLLSIPRRRGKIPIVISFHDYHQPPLEMDRAFTAEGLAHLAVRLRGHEVVAPTPPPAGTPGAPTDRPPGTESTAGFPSSLYETGLDPVETSYPFACYLDALRCVDFLRLQKGLDSGRIGLLGRGFGAAQAVFLAARLKDSVRAVALERPGFVWLPGWLEDAGGDLGEEARAVLGNGSARAKGRAKKALAYVDPLNWAEGIESPVLTAVCLEDEINPPRPGFGFFNRLQTEKAMELYPDENADPGGREQQKKSLKFLAEFLQKR